MAPRSSRRGVPAEEFPILKENGLALHKIEADGNCLFRALSDQLYGHSEDHLKIRRDIVEQMRANPGAYKPYFAVGFVKRNAGRKAARTGPVDSQAASDAKLEEIFQAHLVNMMKPRTWGDQTELRSFVQGYKVDLTVWYPSWKLTFLVENGKASDAHVHIAFHENARHYSSVRNASSDRSAVEHVKATTGEKSETNKSVATPAADTSNKKRKSDVEDTREDTARKDGSTKRRKVNKGLSQQRKKLIELANTSFDR